METKKSFSRKPSRCVLWLTENEHYQGLPDSLQRLVSRGLAVRWSENFGPRTKYSPCVAQEPRIQKPLIMADDDKVYPRHWFKGLVSAYTENPGVIHCYRADRMRVLGLQLAPYNEWLPCVAREPSHLNFVTGSADAIYPMKFLERLKRQGTAFLTCCSKAGDIWISINALRVAFAVAQVHSRYQPAAFSAVPGSQEESLYQVKVLAGGNQRQLLHTLTSDDLGMLSGVQEGNRPFDTTDEMCSS